MPLSYDLQITLEELVLASSFGEYPPKRFGEDLPKERLFDTYFPHTVLAIVGFNTCDLVCPDMYL